MGKIAQVSSKYIINARIDAEGVIDKPDVIGAVFGQTEGLLGSELELRELQRSGRIGRIEVETETRGGKSSGTITIPSSLDKAETSIVAAALEIIERIGPCDAKIKIQSIEDVRVSKRNFVVERAKELLRQLQDHVLPDSAEIANEVSSSVRTQEVIEYGKDRLAAGPAVQDSDEVILVEGRADVINLLRYGFKNAIAMNGTSVTETITELCKKKTVTVFVDGDRGGDLILKSLFDTAEIDFVARAPDGKELEELTQKEIHKALRARITAEQMKLELSREPSDRRSFERGDRPQRGNPRFERNDRRDRSDRPDRGDREQRAPRFEAAPAAPRAKMTASPADKQKFTSLLEELVGTHGAALLDEKLTILGKVPLTELNSTVRSMSGGIYAVVLNGAVDKDLVATAERSNVKFLVGMESQVKPEEARITILTSTDL